MTAKAVKSDLEIKKEAVNDRFLEVKQQIAALEQEVFRLQGEYRLLEQLEAEKKEDK